MTLPGSSTTAANSLTLTASQAVSASFERIGAGSLILNSGVSLTGSALLTQAPLTARGLLNVSTSLSSVDGTSQIVTLTNGAVLQVANSAIASGAVRIANGTLSLNGTAATPQSASATAVPEPSVFALAGMSLTGLLALRRRR